MANLSVNRKLIVVGLVCFVAVLAIGIIHLILTHIEITDAEDIYYSWVEGQRIISGVNPYARILSGNMSENQKYATYFPAFYWLSSASQLLGLRDFDPWMAFWQIIFTAFDIGIAALIFLALDRSRLALVGIFGALFWLFNRWSLDILRISDLDFIPIFFLIGSLMVLPKHQRASLLLFSVSLAVKQIAIFVLPLYLIWVWQTAEKDRIKRAVIALMIIASVPVVTSLPFLIWNAEGFIKSMIFSVTRDPGGHFDALSVGEWFELVGIPARIPLAGMLLLIYAIFFQRRIGMYIAVLFVMAVFLDFNAILFRQYMAWLVPFIPLAVCDIWRDHSTPGANIQTTPSG